MCLFWPLLLSHFCETLGFPDVSGSKEPACNAEDLGSIPGPGRSPRHCAGPQRKEVNLNLIAHVTHEPYELFLLYFLFALVLGTTTKGRVEGKTMHRPKITIMNWGHVASQLREL